MPGENTSAGISRLTRTEISNQKQIVRQASFAVEELGTLFLTSDEAQTRAPAQAAKTVVLALANLRKQLHIVYDELVSALRGPAVLIR
jgi:L-lactate utilization protein LutC